MLNAQIYVLGQDPASIKWRQLKTSNFRIIYPENYKDRALKYIAALESSGKYTLATFNKGQKIPVFNIVLHNKSTMANAMVLPVPLHGDFFDIPGQTLYPQRWEYQLALHEYRHYSQFRKLYTGFGKGLYYVFGQMGPAALLGGFVPLWFLEGDAVVNETLHSKSGRGRSPGFWMDLKAQLIEKKVYKYDKAVLGSYKDYVPDHYTLGYQLLLYGIKNWGYEMWNFALSRVAGRPYYIKPFVNGIKKYSGKRKVKFYNTVMDSLKREWSRDVAVTKITEPHFIKTKSSGKMFSNYRFPMMTGTGKIIAEKSKIDDIRRFVEIDRNGNEKVLFTPGFDYFESLSANDSLICWNEKEYNIRWSLSDKSVVKILNFKTGKLKKIKSDNNLFAPGLSPDGSKIVAVAVSQTGKYSLRIIDIASGKTLDDFKTEDNLYFLTPKWSDDGSRIVSVVLGDKGKSLFVYNVKSKKGYTVLPFTFTEISSPFLKGYKIYYTGTYKGKSDIYVTDIRSGDLFRIVSSKYGATDVFVNKDTIFCSYYTADGYKLAYFPVKELKKERVATNSVFHYPVDDIVKPETYVFENSPHKLSDYKDEKYRKILHLFNIHSWGPLVVDINTYEFVPNAVLMSQNLLGTAVSTLGYYYDINEKAGKVKFTFDYTGLFPVLGFSAESGYRHKTMTDDNGNSRKVDWLETDIRFNGYVPLRFVTNKWIRGVKPSFSAGQKFIHLNENSGVRLKEDNFIIFSYGLSAYNSLKRSRFDIHSPWSQSFSIYFRHTPLSIEPSDELLLSGTVAFPGVLKHHGFSVYAAKQWKTDGIYLFNDLVRTPRGYSELSFTDMVSFKADYYFPVVYPDFDIPSAMYLTRIYADIFYDKAFYTGTDSNNYEISSTGLELYTNWHFLSLPVEFTLGGRFSYLFNDKLKAEFLFSFGY